MNASNRQLLTALVQVAVIAPLMLRGSYSEKNPYFKWGIRIAAGLVVVANFDNATKGVQMIAARAKLPTLPASKPAIAAEPIEGELVNS